MTSMKTVPVLWTLVAVTCFAVLSGMADDRGRKDDRPDAAVVELLKRHFPDLRVSKVEEDKERGERVKEVRLMGEDKSDSVLVKVSAAGEILEVDQNLGQNEVPEHVLRALRKAFPDAEINHAEKETRMEITYQLEIEQNGTKHEVVISRRGRISEVASRD